MFKSNSVKSGHTEKFHWTTRTSKQLKTSLLAQANWRSSKEEHLSPPPSKKKTKTQTNKTVEAVSFGSVWVREARRWSRELCNKLAWIGWRSQGEQGKKMHGAIARPVNLQQNQTLNIRVTDGPVSVSKRAALGIMQKSRSKTEIFLLLGALLHKVAKAPKCLWEGVRLPQDPS